MSDIITIDETTDQVKILSAGALVGYGLTGGFDSGQTLAVSLSSATGTLSAKTALTGSFATPAGASVSLAAGTWLVVAHASIGATNLAATLAASATYGLRIFDGTNPVASVHGSVARDATTNAAQITSAALSTLVTIGVTSTISLQVRGSTDLSVYHQEQGSGATTGNATRIVAVRIL
jgi:hypothetical protein